MLFPHFAPEILRPFLPEMTKNQDVISNRQKIKTNPELALFRTLPRLLF